MPAFAVPVDGATLVGERRDGAGVPLVLVHGFGGTRGDWDAVVAALPASAAIIRYDQRGFGQSPAEPGVAFSHADDLLALLSAWDMPQADLCGMSLGGATVLGCALSAPERVRRLVLVSPMLAGWSWSPEWVALWKTIGRAARSGDRDLARSLWWDHPLFDSTRAGAGADALKASIDAFSGDQWVRDDQRDTSPMVERLHTVSAPTLLLTADHDLPDFRLQADLIAAAVPTVRRIDQPTAGHMLNFEEPAWLARQMAAFLA